MEKDIISAASFYKQSYFFNPDYADLPADVQKELRAIAAVVAEKTRGIVCVGFTKVSNVWQVYIEASSAEEDMDYDEINARAVVDETIKAKAEFFKSLSEWYGLFKTEDGKRKKDEFLKGLPL